MLKDYDIPLRERKHAQTKIDLVRAAVELMAEKRLKDISVKQLCETIPISEVTFYNYFPKKTDLFVYLVQLWMTEMHWHIAQWDREKSAVEVIESLFELFAQKAEERPIVLSEAVRLFAQKPEKPIFTGLSMAERLIAFPELPGIEEIETMNMEFSDLLRQYLERAVAAGELPQDADVETVAMMLDALHIGSIMKIHWRGTLPLKTLYRRQLQILWDGLWAQSPQERPFQSIPHVCSEN